MSKLALLDLNNLSHEEQLRVVALQEAVRMGNSWGTQAADADIDTKALARAKKFETFLKSGATS